MNIVHQKYSIYHSNKLSITNFIALWWLRSRLGESFIICLSAAVVERQPYSSSIILLHHAPPMVASMRVLLSSLIDKSLPLATVVAHPVTLHSTLLHQGYSQWIGGNWQVPSSLLSAVLLIYFRSLNWLIWLRKEIICFFKL